jgi:hypothetical protein
MPICCTCCSPLCLCFDITLAQAAEYESTLANITELEEALALAQEQVDASNRCGVVLSMVSYMVLCCMEGFASLMHG